VLLVAFDVIWKKRFRSVRRALVRQATVHSPGGAAVNSQGREPLGGMSTKVASPGGATVETVEHDR
jgi:hypothetical protein